jgi:hypothetical protein
MQISPKDVDRMGLVRPHHGKLFGNLLTEKDFPKLSGEIISAERLNRQ